MAPKTKEQNEQIRKETAASIKETALELFGTFGYHSTSISQIARAAGVSKGLMYNYFESKEALLHEMIIEAMEEGEALMEQALSRSDDPYEQLKSIVDMSIEWITENLHHWKLLTSLAFQMDILKGLEDVVQEKQKSTIAEAVEIFRRLGARQPMEEALLFGAVLDGMMLHYMQMEDNYPMEMMRNYILNKFKPKDQS